MVHFNCGTYHNPDNTSEHKAVETSSAVTVSSFRQFGFDMVTAMQLSVPYSC